MKKTNIIIETNKPETILILKHLILIVAVVVRGNEHDLQLNVTLLQT